MADTYPHAQQRAQLELFLKSIGARPSTLRKDACGDPAIMGTKGHVMAASFVSWVKPVRPGKQSSTASAGSMLYVVTESAMAWTYAKRALRFAVVTRTATRRASCGSTACRPSRRPRRSAAISGYRRRRK